MAADWNRPPQGKATPNKHPMRDNGPYQATNTIQEWLKENEKEPLTWPVNSPDPSAIEPSPDTTLEPQQKGRLLCHCPPPRSMFWQVRAVLEAGQGDRKEPWSVPPDGCKC